MKRQFTQAQSEKILDAVFTPLEQSERLAPSEFFLIAESNRPIAAIVPLEVTPTQRDAIYRLLPSQCVMNLTLAKRWNVWGVFCTPEWAQEQLHRVPMLRPKGQRLTIG